MRGPWYTRLHGDLWHVSDTRCIAAGVQGYGIRPQEQSRLGDVGVQDKCVEGVGASPTNKFGSGTAMHRLFGDENALEQEGSLTRCMGLTV